MNQLPDTVPASPAPDIPPTAPVSAVTQPMPTAPQPAPVTAPLNPAPVASAVTANPAPVTPASPTPAPTAVEPDYRAMYENLRRENEILRQNAETASRSPVQAVSGGGVPVENDDFIRGFDSDTW